MSNKRSVFKKSGGLRQRMVVHYVPRGGSLTYCSRYAADVFFTDKADKKRIGCKNCLSALGMNADSSTAKRRLEEETR